MNRPDNLPPPRGMLPTLDTNYYRGPYTCPELGRNPGLCDSRFDAYRLPSRMGNKLVEPRRMYGEAP